MSRQRVCGLAIVYSLSVLLAFELAGRVNFFTHHRLPFFTPASQLAYRFYPNLRPVMNDTRQDCVRVLVLGGSTLNRGWSNFEERFHDELSAALGQPVCVFNTSMPARTSLDSYYKYWYLRSKGFDLVILYNAINELRTNGVPDDVWRDDYSHYAWYDEANFYFQHQQLAQWYVILPFYLKHLAVAWDRKIVHRSHRVPYNSELIRPDWVKFGARIKSAGPYRRNIQRTLELARSKHEPVLLMTFAYYLPANYSRERLEKGELDYDRPLPPLKPSPVEVWGLPENVKKGLDVHNQILRELASSEGVIFVDQQALMGNAPKNFIDICHFSSVGLEQFIRNSVAELRKRGFGASPRSRTTSQPPQPQLQ